MQKSKDLLWKFVKKYKPNINEKDYPIFDSLNGDMQSNILMM